MELMSNAVLALSGLTLALAVLMCANRALARPGHPRRSTVVPVVVALTAAAIGAWTTSSGGVAPGRTLGLWLLLASLAALAATHVAGLASRGTR